MITTFGSLIQAVGVGVLLASLLFMKRSSDLAEKGTSVLTLSGVVAEKPWDDEINLYEEFKDRIYIKHLYGPMFFGFTSYFQDLVKELDQKIRVLIIRMDRVPHIDQSGLYAMEEVILELRRKGVLVVFTGLNDQPCDMFRRIDIIPDLVPEHQLFQTFEESIQWVKQTLVTEEKNKQK